MTVDFKVLASLKQSASSHLSSEMLRPYFKLMVWSEWG